MLEYTENKTWGAKVPDPIAPHETNHKDLSSIGLNEVVTPVFSPYFIGRKSIDAIQIEWIHRLEA